MIAVVLAPLAWMAFGDLPGSLEGSAIEFFERSMELLGKVSPFVLLGVLFGITAEPPLEQAAARRINWRRVGIISAVCVAFGILLMLEGLFPCLLRSPLSLNGLLKLIKLFGLPVLILARINMTRRPSTHVSRRWGVALVFCIPLIPLMFLPPSDALRPEVLFGVSLPLLVFSSGLAVFSLPGRLMAVLPLAFVFFGLSLLVRSSPYLQASVYVPFLGASWLGGIAILGSLFLAALIFPKHRRIIEFWRPRWLPRIRPAKPAQQGGTASC